MPHDIAGIGCLRLSGQVFVALRIQRPRPFSAPKEDMCSKHVGKLGHNEVALYITDFDEPLITAVTPPDWA